ncbi:MAG: hypothetical protein GPJ51_02680 [Candidatus Heimdallarchaeota archaeon]|nr:hypothetical protein [Candidatus Heimdallarchaeota archaeon]
MNERPNKIEIRTSEYLEGKEVTYESDRALIFRIYKLLKSETSTIKGFVILISLMSLASLIIVSILLHKINSYGCY